MFEAFLTSTSAVVLAEIGDKTQLLAFLLAARFHKNIPIIIGIFVATVLNHGLAGLLGEYITRFLSPEVMRWLLAGGFLAMAIWMLIPDKEDGDALDNPWILKMGVFGATFVTFFLAEMGDKTQIATVALAAHYQSAFWVICGTTLGMLIADVPAVFFGDKIAHKIPMKVVHIVCAILFAGLGVAAFFV